MIILEPDDLQNGIVVNAAQALDDDEYYAMLDSGTNAIIVPLHRRMEGEVAECQVPSATVTGPLVQVYEFEGKKRLVVALPSSAILVSQEWLTSIAGWTFVSGQKPGLEGSACENIVYRAGANKSYKLSMKNGLPYLSRELFWLGMHDIARKAKRISGHTLDDLQEMLDTMAREPQPQIYPVKTIAVPEPSNVVFTAVPHTMHFKPSDVRREIIRWFEHFHPTLNLNRGRLSGSAASLTFGAQTGRGSDRSCVIKRTLDYDYHSLSTLVHQLAQNAAGSVLPYLGFQILRLGPGQNLNQHRDYHSHAEYPNHTMKFGKYTGGSLQMLRNGQWYSYDSDCQWMSFDALKVVHRVTPVQTGARYSITLYTPGKLDRLTAQDWDNLAKCGFPIYLYEPLPAKMRRLTITCHEPEFRARKDSRT